MAERSPDLPRGGNIAIGGPLKRRLESMRDGKQAALGRQVTLSEIVEDLLAEHDKALEANPI